ncbi:outer membrane beta-barrel protein [Arcticibacter sp. MXS-1]|uniref:outer membrane beta-barrel protein n=1 Tax=Arcticibacter sp. MXS-1 TaxID=3341726 RepID=UPI0035A88ECF
MIRFLAKCLCFSGVFVATGTRLFAQDSASVSPLVISGSVDAYYKYDFARIKGGSGNIPTSFASDNNSVSLGMIDVALKKSTGKASFVGEVAFGPRGQYQSIPNGDGTDGNTFHVQNLYMTYALSEKFSLTGGYMGTFVGYEVISPAGNFNYSTSYLFTSGPFQNAGIKANYAFSDKLGLMVGLFNDWNTYRDFNGVSHFGAQLFLSPVKGWSAYINVLTGRSAAIPASGDDPGVAGSAVLGSGTIVDLTTAYQISESFKLGLNAADYSLPADNGGYSGVALYPQYAFSASCALGLRGEYFKVKDVIADGLTAEGASVAALTLSANLKSGGLTFIPEVRLDSSSDRVFSKNNSSFSSGLKDSKRASQFSFAVVYSF